MWYANVSFLRIMFSNERVPPGGTAWLARIFVCGTARVNGRESPWGPILSWPETKQTSTFVYWYTKFSTVLGIDKRWSVDPPSQVEKKINFFLIFIAHVLRKETWFDLNAVKSDFHLFAVKSDVFFHERRFTILIKERRQELWFLCLFKKYKLQ